MPSMTNWCDKPIQGKAAFTGSVGGQGLLRQGGGMAWIGRCDRCAQFNALSLPARDGAGTHGVQAKHVGHPDTVKAALLSVLGKIDDILKAVADAGCCPGEKSDAHGVAPAVG